MSFQNQTLKVRPTKGIAFDVDPWEVGPEYYTKALNIMFRDSFPSRDFGEAEVYATPLSSPSFLQAVTTESGNFWVYTGDSKVSVVQGVTHSDISWATQSTVALGNAWTGGLINNIVFLNNGLDFPHYWDGNPANAMIPLPGWPVGTNCKAMRAFRFFLFAMDITEPAGSRTNKLLWSSAAEPGTVPNEWTPTISNDAGFVELSSTQGPIIDGGALRESMMLYKANSTWAADFIGGNSVFSFRKVLASSGILNRNCFVEFESNHVILTDSDVVMTDGFSVQSIADNRVRNLINSTVDADTILNSFVAHNKATNEIWVCIAAVGRTEPNVAAIWNYRHDTWTLRDIPSVTHATSGIISESVPDNTWDAQAESWDLYTGGAWNDQGFSLRSDEMVMAGYADTKLYQVDQGTSFDGDPVPAVLLKESMAMDDPDRFKTVKRVWPKITGANGVVVNLRVGSQASIGDPTEFTALTPFTIGTDRYVDIFSNGRYMTFEFASTGIEPWSMTGFDVEYRLGSFF